MKITLESLLGIIPEAQEVMIFEGGLQLNGTCDALSCLLSHCVLNCEVVNIEAEKDLLKVWVEGA